MLIDPDTRLLFASEHTDRLRLAASPAARPSRTRRWLSSRLIAAADRLNPGPTGPRPMTAPNLDKSLT